MFYSQFILAKKGPLGTIWIAAHLERKLRKNQVADTDIGVSVGQFSAFCLVPEKVCFPRLGIKPNWEASRWFHLFSSICWVSFT
ncbi:Sister chromatid cohesion 1 protein 4 [Vitis vinifera]|uniref:Sister chromatid cohesion 1 protein 4 n=1 Tax=Vitis vinifera TaxID=29760 RepID=A0A438KQS5_VITVI|nr:Sister chromatid cohesion 1 protein 4 [Vitis vinifera]